MSRLGAGAFVGIAMFTAATMTTSAAGAVELELKNDGFTDNGQAVCQQGFATGDQAGVSFTHDADFRLLRVQFLFCGASSTETMTLRVYRDTGGAVPGEILFAADYQITGAMDALSEIDLSGEGLSFSAGDSFRVALEHQHDGAPGLANDTDGTTTPGVSWIYDTLSSSWAEAASFGVNGDWIMRAYVDVEGSGTGGMGGSPMSTTSSMMTGSGGTGGAGGSAADDPGDEESCSCRVVGGRRGSAGYLWLGAAALVLARRRRRG